MPMPGTERHPDAPPLTKIVLFKIDALEDYQRSRLLEMLHGLAGSYVPVDTLAATLKAAGIATTQSQLNGLVAYVGGDERGLPLAAVMRLMEKHDAIAIDGDDRSGRNSSDLSGEMLARFQALRHLDGRAPMGGQGAEPPPADTRAPVAREAPRPSPPAPAALTPSAAEAPATISPPPTVAAPAASSARGVGAPPVRGAAGVGGALYSPLDRMAEDGAAKFQVARFTSV